MNNSPDRRPLRIWFTESWPSYLWIPLSSPGACTSAKTPESVKRWNYLSKSLVGNFAQMTASSPFMQMFIATNLRQVIDCDIEVTSCEYVFKTRLSKTHD